MYTKLKAIHMTKTARLSLPRAVREFSNVEISVKEVRDVLIPEGLSSEEEEKAEEKAFNEALDALEGKFARALNEEYSTATKTIKKLN